MTKDTTILTNNEQTFLQNTHFLNKNKTPGMPFGFNSLGMQLWVPYIINI